MLIRTLVGCYYNKITTVCACGPTHILIRTHTCACTLAHAHILVSRPTFSHPYPHAHTIAHSRGNGARTPMFQTFNQQHNPLQKFGKNCKNLWSAKARSSMGPGGPNGPAA